MVTIVQEDWTLRRSRPSANRAPSTTAGIYGLRIKGLGDSELLTTVDADAPVLEVTTETGDSAGRIATVTEDRAEAGLVDGGWLSVRRTGTAHFVLSEPVSREELLHPLLAPAAGAVNAWHGRQVAHAGAFAIGGHAVALMGDKEHGKSTLLAWLARWKDVEVLTDDLIVVDQGRILAGPRCIDLRPGSVAMLEREHQQRLVRGGTRSRLILPPCQSSAVLAAIVILTWGTEDHVTMTHLSAAEALPELLPHTQVAEGAGLFELLGVPVWRLSRPRAWSSLPEVERNLRALVA